MGVGRHEGEGGDAINRPGRRKVVEGVGVTQHASHRACRAQGVVQGVGGPGRTQDAVSNNLVNN